MFLCSSWTNKYSDLIKKPIVWYVHVTPGQTFTYLPSLSIRIYYVIANFDDGETCLLKDRI